MLDENVWTLNQGFKPEQTRTEAHYTNRHSAV